MPEEVLFPHSTPGLTDVLHLQPVLITGIGDLFLLVWTFMCTNY